MVLRTPHQHAPSRRRQANQDKQGSESQRHNNVAMGTESTTMATLER